ncbi:MAG: peptidoglycan-binding protein [Firmicutes bacterium]|nr:peptidoglycan-binding protein [Bacillota bacterium]
MPLKLGDHNLAVKDLQRRLNALGMETDDTYGYFGLSTQKAVSEFQAVRGLIATGECSRQTWDTLVESGWKLGDRMLYRRTPMFKGDDVAQLQRNLSAYGFDPGRIDGIFGNDTDFALRDFQRNCGLLVDGICGQRTIHELNRLRPANGGTALVSPLRERWTLISKRETGLAGKKIVVCEPGGFDKATTALKRFFGRSGANVFVLPNINPSTTAAEANQLAAELVISLNLEPATQECSIHYYKGYRYESEASRQLAELIEAELSASFNFEATSVIGMATPILRETRMPAVELYIGNVKEVVKQITSLASTIITATTQWIEHDWE